MRFTVMRLQYLLLVSLLFLVTPAHAEEQSRFDRIFGTKQITCGSFVFNGLFEYAAEGNQPTGFFADVMTEASRRLGLTVTFKEIGSFATGFEELKSGRYDMLCASLASFAGNYGKMLFTTALFYDPIFVWGDASRDFSALKAVSDINQPNWRLSGMDGELGGIFGPIVFPNAKMHMVSQMSGAPTIILDMLTGKADFVLLTKAAAQAYTVTNPGKLQQVIAVPAAAYPIRFVFRPEDMRLKIIFDMVLEDMRADGSLQQLIKKYNLN